MTIRARIVLLTGGVALLLLLAVSALVLSLQESSRLSRRLDAQLARMQQLSDIEVHTVDYSAAVLRAILIGRAEESAVQAARVQMARSLASLLRLTRDQIATLDANHEIQRELPEVENSRRIAEIFNSVDRAASRAVVMRRDSGSTAALDLYTREVAFRVANELQALISRELNDERREIADETAAAQALQFQVMVASAIAVALGLLFVGVIAFRLHQSITRSVNTIAAVAHAGQSGVPTDIQIADSKDEFAPVLSAVVGLSSALQQLRAGEQEASARATTQLEQRARELSEANERLRVIDERRGEFLADVSHQLRTPVTILRGEADIALRGRHSIDEHTESLRRIQAQAVEMAHMLDDLLSNSRSDFDPQPLTLEIVSLENAISSAVRESTVLAEAREAVIDTRLDDENGHVNADFRALRQALVIGLDNAIKHSPPGGEITVSTSRQGDQLRISIRDPGAGIDPEDLPRVFERFYRSRREDEMLNSGFGIGLSVAKRIVDAHSGTISLDNHPEGGGEFVITLPAAPERQL